MFPIEVEGTFAEVEFNVAKNPCMPLGFPSLGVPIDGVMTSIEVEFKDVNEGLLRSKCSFLMVGGSFKNPVSLTFLSWLCNVQYFGLFMKFN